MTKADLTEIRRVLKGEWESITKLYGRSQHPYARGYKAAIKNIEAELKALVHD